ncbi:MAG: hypothetical protein GXO73_10360 [Calditrichaeota bacterium]|nr:hypothetical protein [Calditrichota bacterium]
MHLTKRVWAPAALAFLVGTSSLSLARADTGYHSYASLTEKLKSLASAYPRLVHLESIGKSSEGRELWLLEITDHTAGKPADKPGVFVVGNLEGHHVVGSELALGVAEELANGYGQIDSVTQLLKRRVFYILPRANPDGAEFMFRKVRWEHPANTMPWDDDFDDVADEDGPDDLNGDGWITQMRVRDPEGEYRQDPKDPRLLVKVDRAKGERGQYKLYTEGVDDDGDEAYNEDGPGGINPDRNFPRDYPYNKPGAGRYQLQAPEAKAIVDFLLSHRNVGVALAFCLHDNLIHPPKAERGSRGQSGLRSKMDSRSRRRMFGRKPAAGVNTKDIPYYEHLSKVYKHLLNVQGEPLVRTEKPAGAFFQWAYFQYGVPSFATVGWFPTLPRERKAVKDTTGRKGTGARSGMPGRAGRGMRRPERPEMAGAPKGREPENADAKWLKWLKKYRGGYGFVEWKPVQHPQLGEVEVGGFLPFVRTNPPDTALPRLVVGHTRFVALLGASLPEIKIAEVKATPLGGGVVRVELTVENDGYLPTVFAHAARARAVKPTRVEVETKAKMLSGRKITFLDPIPGSGGRAKAEWIFRGKKGTRVRLRVVSEKAGTVETTVKLPG